MTTLTDIATSGRLVHRPVATGPAFWGPGDHYTFLVTGEESGGAYFAMEALVPPGGGPPPHSHTREDETCTPSSSRGARRGQPSAPTVTASLWARRSWSIAGTGWVSAHSPQTASTTPDAPRAHRMPMASANPPTATDPIAIGPMTASW